MTKPIGTIQIAFGVNPGTVPTNAQWTDVSVYCDVGGCARGRSSETDSFTPGTFSATLKNRDRRFDPDNTAGPYYPNIKPMVRLRYGLGYMPLVLADVPLSYWRFGESSGTSAVDELAANNGTYVNSPTLAATGRIANNTAVSCDGTNDHVTVPDSFVVNNAIQTIECWIKPTVVGRAGLFCQQNAVVGTVPTGWVPYLFVRSSGKLVAGVWTGSAAVTAEYATALTAGNWYHVAWVWDGSTLRLYVNGVQVNSAAAATFNRTAGGTKNEWGTGYIDTTWDSGAAANYYYFNGVIDEAAVYTRALSAAEILEHYTEGVTGNPDGWRFTGFVERWPQVWPTKVNEATVPITAVDGTIVLEAATLPSSVYELEVRADSPAHWWRLNDSSGSTVAVDQVSKSFGSYTGGAIGGGEALVAEDPATSMTIPNATGLPAMEVPNGAGISSSPFSLELWMATQADPIPHAGYLYIQNPIDSNNPPSGVIRLSLSSAVMAFVAGNGDITLNTSTKVDDTNPHHIVVTYDGTTPKLYVDGADVTTTIFNTAPSSYYNQDIRVGSWQRAGVVPPAGLDGFPFPGRIQDVALYTSALSAARVLAHYNAGKAGTSGAWGGQLSGTRVADILDAAVWPTSERNIDAGNSTLQPTPLAATAKSLIDKAVRSEQGAGFFQQDGKYRFRDRHTPLTAAIHITSQATFGDGGGTEIPYLSIGEFEYSADRVLNDVRGNRRGGPTQQSVDTTSQTTYLHRTDNTTLTDLEVSTDSEIVDACDWRLAHYKDPLTRPLRVEIQPSTATEWNAVLSREIGHRITLKRRPPGGGSAISKDVLIERIEDSAPDYTDYRVAFDVSVADTQAYWIWDTSTWDTSTRWAY